jgi:ATPase subunit of ABC transporter with duplicated ATPase domains
VVPGHFAQTHEHPEFAGRTLVDLLWTEASHQRGAAMLLLDEPTDNLDVASAEALEEGLEAFDGTVVAVTHDRWFARSFDRYVVFGADGTVREVRDFETELMATL